MNDLTEITDSDGRSPLAIAIENDNREVERYLRDNGCTLDDGDKQCLLLKACERGQLDSVKKLVDSDNSKLTSKHCML